MKPRLTLRRSAVAVAVFLIAGCRAVNVMTPPGQPASGPGGRDYPHAKVITQRLGEGNEEYWLFQPDDPRPAQAPVVVFLHGWGGMDPVRYGAWLRHIVRKGHTVIFPRYQASLMTPASEMTPAALSAVRDALSRLSTEGPVRPRLDGIAWVGHSLGGIIAANLAATSVELGLPPPALVMGAEPGGESRLAVEPLGGIPPQTLVLLAVGEDDDIVADHGARAILEGLAHLPRENVELVTIRSEDRSDPPLEADHFAPLASVGDFPPPLDGAGMPLEAPAGRSTGPIRQRISQRQIDRYAPDALDYYGFWKLLDGLCDSAFRGVHREYALGDTPQQRYMGRLSNGEAVTPIEVESDSSLPP